MRRLSEFLCLLCVLPAQAGAETSAADLLIGKLAAVETLEARYLQTDSLQEQQAGAIWLRKPATFRIESAAPLSQTIVSDGESLWTWDRDLEQVVISPLSDRAEYMPILLFVGQPEKVTETWVVSHFRDEIQDYFVLEPLDSGPAISGLTLVFRGNEPVQVLMRSANGEQTSVDFEVLHTGGSIDDERFQLRVPEGVDVIDDR